MTSYTPLLLKIKQCVSLIKEKKGHASVPAMPNTLRSGILRILLNIMNDLVEALILLALNLHDEGAFQPYLSIESTTVAPNSIFR